MQNALAVVTVVVAGMMVGVEFAVAVFVNPILNRLPDDSRIAARSDGAQVLGRVMPVWYISSMLLGVVWASTAWGSTGAPLVTAATALLGVSVAMSLLLLVPINNRTKSWTAEGRPADWKQQAARWDRYHYVRVGVIVLAFALFAVALSR
ncbi:anthrone oxygenase family protein [Streptomyces sp. NPDC001407]|uniref:anthrone oxygenase family protein n=1 Tax=Streptomyces sp. NPDC001407 TaxID=3364573 RepID=UPI0036A8BB74